MSAARGAPWAWAGAALASLLLLLSVTAPHVGYPMGKAWAYMMAVVPVLFLLLGWSLARQHQSVSREARRPEERQA